MKKVTNNPTMAAFGKTKAFANHVMKNNAKSGGLPTKPAPKGLPKAPGKDFYLSPKAPGEAKGLTRAIDKVRSRRNNN
jgi:hypothetical protein